LALASIARVHEDVYVERLSMTHIYKVSIGMLRLVLLMPLALLAACGADETPEQQVRAVIERMELAAEERDASALSELLSPQYRDAHGNGPEEARRLMRGYFIANQSIRLLTRVQELTFPYPDEARATVVVAMAGRDAEAAGVWPVSADLRTFEIVLRRESKDWKVSWARWDRQ
jgi:hypothetical protein